jgi:RNA polymerase sigma-70 factor (ECF subfamily)
MSASIEGLGPPKDGHESSFAAVYRRCYVDVYRYMTAVLGEEHEAEDVTQQVFLEIWRALPRYEHRGTPIKAWVLRIARNRALNYQRGRARSDIPWGDSIAGMYEELGHRDGASARSAEQSAVGLLRRLPTRTQKILALRFLAELPIAEVAELLEMTPAAVSQAQHRAVLQFRERAKALEQREAAKRMTSEGDVSVVHVPMTARS